MNALIIPAILLGIVFILETLGMPDKWACLCGILVLPVTIIITAIIDHKTHYFTNKQREINKARARAKELHEEWIRDNQDFIRKENKRIDREIDEMGEYPYGKETDDETSSVVYPVNCGNGGDGGFSGLGGF